MIRGSNRGDNVKTTVYMGLKSTNETNQHGAHGHFHRGTPWPEPGQWDQGLNMANKVMKKVNISGARKCDQFVLQIEYVIVPGCIEHHLCSIIITKILVSVLLLTCALGTILFTTESPRVQHLWGRLAQASARPHSLNIAAASVTS